MPAKPSIIIAHVAGSGTAATAKSAVSASRDTLFSGLSHSAFEKLSPELGGSRLNLKSEIVMPSNVNGPRPVAKTGRPFVTSPGGLVGCVITKAKDSESVVVCPPAVKLSVNV